MHLGGKKRLSKSADDSAAVETREGRSAIQMAFKCVHVNFRLNKAKDKVLHSNPRYECRPRDEFLERSLVEDLEVLAKENFDAS